MKNRENITILIHSANFILAILLLSSIYIFASHIKENNFEKAITSIQTIIPIIAAWLVLCIADRQISREDAQRIYESKLQKLQCIHYLIFLLQDLRNKSCYFSSVIISGGNHMRPINMNLLSEDIRTKYEKIISNEMMYKFISGDLLNQINYLSPSIFGITSVIDNASSEMEGNKINTQEYSKIFSNVELISIREKNSNLEKEFNKIIDQLYEISDSTNK